MERFSSIFSQLLKLFPRAEFRAHARVLDPERSGFFLHRRYLLGVTLWRESLARRSQVVNEVVVSFDRRMII